jgi:hypothetical protein
MRKQILDYCTAAASPRSIAEIADHLETSFDIASLKVLDMVRDGELWVEGPCYPLAEVRVWTTVIGECEWCGLFDHHLVRGECPSCRLRTHTVGAPA